MFLTLAFILATFTFFYYLYHLYSQNKHSYWPSRGVTLIPFSEVGTFWQLITKKITIIGIDQAYYERIRSKSGGSLRYGGMMEFFKPVLMVTDLELIKNVLVKDFDHFVDRRKIKSYNDPIFSQMVVSLEGQKWKDVRSVLTPAFTTGKMKIMFEQFNACGKEFVSCVKSHPEDEVGGHRVIIQDLVARYTIDVIGRTAFGMETNALKDPNSAFLKMSRIFSDITVMRLVKNFTVMFFPRLSSWLGVKLMDPKVMDFFTGILGSALNARESNGQKRNDFLQLLVEARAGELKTEKDEELESFEKDAILGSTSTSTTSGQKLFTDNNLTNAQSFIFFVAGFDTVGALVNFAAYLMAAYPEVQERIYEEVKNTMESSEDGQIDYDTVARLEYMDMFISEILRRYPPANRLERRCIKEYKVPDSDLIIEKDQLVAVSVQGIHMDPEIYPDPLTFDPERFSPENKAKRHPYAYLPFGMGPRNCIGMRFALMESKVALAYFAYYFRIEPTENTPIPVKIDAKVGLNRPIANLELRFVPRNH